MRIYRKAGSRKNGVRHGSSPGVVEEGSERVVELVAVAVKTDNAGDGLDMTGTAAPGDEDNDIHRLGDQRARRRQSDFEDQLFQAQQRTVGGTGVDGGDAAGMPSAPDLDEVQRFTAAHLTDYHAVGPQ